ncbi:MAG: glutamate--tRNA ligase [Clostridia bacterium]|nr:glutamate--tRNA ligase [Clostridia bacterium]
MDYKKLADLLYPNTTKTIQDYLNLYPSRNLPNGAEVTRFAPSPTGYLHFGNFYGATIDKMIAKSSNGIFYMRLEDTDQKRLIADADKVALQILEKFNITPDEGYLLTGQEGNYGPYKQSERVEIYNTFAKHLVSIGRAYPCFCKKRENKEEILQERTEQLSTSNTIEIKDLCRELTLEQVVEHLNNGDEWALRFKSLGKNGETFKYTDVAKGERVIPKNSTDYVIVKSNGIPVYHLAHVVDDILMHTTTVVRGNEWMGTLPLHIEMFEALNMTPPKYLHNALILIKDKNTGNSRKISKRYDPEADMRFYLTSGYPVEAVNRYVMNLINSEYEPWALANPNAKLEEYPFNPHNLTTSDPMFDIVKLNDISKTVISKYSTAEAMENILTWAKEYAPNDYEIITKYKDLFTSVISIDRECNRPRKDITKFDEVIALYDYILPEFKVNSSLEFGAVNRKCLKEFLQDYTQNYTEASDNSEWFANIKQCALNHNFADMKDYKKSPKSYAGSVADAVKFVRFAITGRINTPELYTIMKTITKPLCISRLQEYINKF